MKRIIKDDWNIRAIPGHNLPPGIPFSKRAEKAIEKWAKSAGTRVEDLKRRARQRPDGSLDMSDPESDLSDLPPAPLILIFQATVSENESNR